MIHEFSYVFMFHEFLDCWFDCENVGECVFTVILYLFFFLICFPLQPLFLIAIPINKIFSIPVHFHRGDKNE